MRVINGAQSEAPVVDSDAQRSGGVLRVLHVNSGNLYGGVETILVTLARLRDLCPGMESSFALCHAGRLSLELTETGVPVYLLGKVRISRPWTVWRSRRRLRKLLEREQFHIVICHMPWSLAVFGKAVRAAGRKLGFWAHAFHTGRSWLERLARRSVPDLAISNSHFTDGGLREFLPAVRHGVVYPPVALTTTTENDRWRSTLRKQEGVGEDTVVIIQVSRLEACKGHALHLEALSQLRSLKTPWVCWMVGGPQRPEEDEYLLELHHAAARLGLTGRVKFLGQRTDIPQLLAAADVFCQPNQTADSFGIAFIEALWAERPVITTALGGAVEIISGACGMLVAPGDTAGLTTSLQQLIEDPESRARLGQAGPARALQLCNPETQLRTLNDLVRGIAHKTVSES